VNVLKKHGLDHNKQIKGNKKVTMSKQGLTIDGRPLLISRAISKKDVKNLERKNKEDKRNLYLLKEGYISEEDSDFDSLSKIEKERRKTSLQQRKKKLENPNFSVSRVRLSVQNIPANMDNKQFKALFHKAAIALRKKQKYACRHGIPKITQAKVVTDKQRVDKNGKLKSRQFGFIQFREHQDALAVLRKMNNHSSEKTGNRKLQIEFALENERVLHNRKERTKSSRKGNKNSKKKKESEKEVDNKQDRRGKKRKQQERFFKKLKRKKEKAAAAPE